MLQVVMQLSIDGDTHVTCSTYIAEAVHVQPPFLAIPQARLKASRISFSGPLYYCLESDVMWPHYLFSEHINNYDCSRLYYTSAKNAKLLMTILSSNKAQSCHALDIETCADEI